MSVPIDRRAFVRAALGVLAVASVTRAQTSGKTWRVGWARAGSPGDPVDAALRDGLRALGYVDGSNLVIDTRYAQGRQGGYPVMVGELLGLKPDLLVVGGPAAVRAALKATATIPIVALDLESDPVASGFVKSLNRPGGNLTGVFLDLPELAGKQLQFLREALPGMKRVAVVWDPSVVRPQFEATEVVARDAGIGLLSLPIHRVEDLDTALALAGRERVNALSVLTSPLFFAHRTRIADLALKQRLPSISIFSVYPEAGGLMAYGPNFPVMYRGVAAYVDRIFKGANPGELPVERPTTFELVINVKTAKVLGLALPQALLARADRLIQ